MGDGITYHNRIVVTLRIRALLGALFTDTRLNGLLRVVQPVILDFWNHRNRTGFGKRCQRSWSGGFRDSLAIAERIVEKRLELFGPDHIPRLARVQQILRHARLHYSVRGQEPAVEIAPENALSVRKRLYFTVHEIVAHAQRIVDRRTPRKDRMHDYLRLWILDLEMIHNGLNPENGIGRRLDIDIAMAGVVRADHENECLGRKIRQLTVAETPQHMFGAIAGDAAVEGLVRALRKILRPYPRSAGLPSMRNRISKKHDVISALLGQSPFGVKSRKPHLVRPLLLRKSWRHRKLTKERSAQPCGKCGKHHFAN